MTELNVERLEAFLDEHGLGFGPITWSRIGFGQSNITYRVQRTGADLVVRRGPQPPYPPSAHDMVREARVQRLVAQAGVPVPEILAVCEDTAVLGVPFYVSRFIDGVVVLDRAPPGLDDVAGHRAISEAVIDTLVGIHAVDVSRGPIAEIGRPDGYLERQVKRFAQLWKQNSERDLPDVDRLADWLGAHRPESTSSSVVHGDYRLGNLMMSAEAPAAVEAVLDWELSTLGDPLSDLGYLVATWSIAGERETVMHLSPVTASPGYFDRDELVARYADRTGADMRALPWYEALALWKAAVFCEAIYTRWRHGERPGDEFGPALEEGIPELFERARASVGLGAKGAA